MARASIRKQWAHYIEGTLSSGAQKIPLIQTPVAFEGYILGVDPSIRGTGIALLHIKKGHAEFLGSETLRFKKEVHFSDCLLGIFKQINDYIKTYPLGHAALESTIYVQNFKIAHQMGAARGVAIAAIRQQGWSIHEYAPLRVKKAVSGLGRASKIQIAKIVAQHLSLQSLLASDEADAAAIALCHAWTFKQ